MLDYHTLSVLIVSRDPQEGHLGAVIKTTPPRECVKTLPHRRHLRFCISISIYVYFRLRMQNYNMLLSLRGRSIGILFLYVRMQFELQVLVTTH